MARRRLNWKLLIVIIISITVLAVTALVLRKWNRTRLGLAALEKGSNAYSDGDWQGAAINLGRYIAASRNNADSEIYFKYAEAQLNIRPIKKTNIRQAISSYKTILRIDKENAQAFEKLFELYLQMNIYGEAELVVARRLDIKDGPVVRTKLALALIGQRKLAQAQAELFTVIENHPEEISAYEILGMLAEKQTDSISFSATQMFDSAVENNPNSANAYIIRASYLLRKKEIEKAIADLKKAETMDLSAINVRLRLANEYINANVLDKAEKQFSALYVLTPADQQLWQSWAALALRFGLEAKMLEVAENGLKQLSSQPWDFMPVAAELFIYAGRIDRANDCIEKLKQKGLATARVFFLQGLIAQRSGSYNRALKMWQQAIQSGEKSVIVHVALANMFMRLGDSQSSINCLRKLLLEQPNSFQAHLNLALALYKIGNFYESSKETRRAIEINHGSFQANLLYLQTRIQLLITEAKSPDSAEWQNVEAQLEQLEDASGGGFEVKLTRFELALACSQFEKAEQIMNQLNEKYPAKMEVAAAGAELLKAKGNLDEAIIKLSTVVQQFPQQELPARNLAILLARQEKTIDCENVLIHASKRLDNTAAKRRISLLLADFYDSWGQNEQSLQMLEKIRLALPEDIPIKRRLLRNDNFLRDAGQAQKLIDEIAMILSKENWQYKYEQTKLWFTSDDFEARYSQIISLLKENLLANPDDRQSRLLFAKVYHKAGHLQLAITNYRELLSRYPADISIIVPMVSALYETKQFDEADDVINHTMRENLYHPELSKLQLQSYLRGRRFELAGTIVRDIIVSDPGNKSMNLLLALIDMRTEKFDQAEKILTQLANGEPNSISIAAAQIELCIRRGQMEKAMTFCNRLVEKFQDASAYLVRANIKTKLGQIDAAAKDFEQATQVEPENIQAWLSKSDFYNSIKKKDLAINSMKKAISLDSQNHEINKRAISLYLSYGTEEMFNQGQILLDKALSLEPADTQLNMLNAKSLMVSNTADTMKEAADILERITEIQPENAQAWTLLAQILLKSGDPSSAMNIAMKALAHLPNNRKLLLIKARAEAEWSPALSVPTLEVLHGLDQNDTEVATFLAEVMILDGKAAQAADLLTEQLIRCRKYERDRITLARAVAIYKSGNKTQAESCFKSLSQKNPEDIKTIFMAQTRLLLEDQRWDDIEIELSGLRQNYPNDVDTFIRLAGLMADCDKPRARRIAEDTLRIVLKKDADSVEAMTILAVLLQSVGRGKEAVDFYQRILQIEPANPIAINNLAWIICEERGQYDQALKLVLKGSEKFPDYADLIDTRGVIYYRLGKLNSSIQDFTKCLSLYPPRSPARACSYFHLARAQAELGQFAQAEKNLENALQINSRIGGLSAVEENEVKKLLVEFTKDSGNVRSVITN